jgi:titin
MARFECIVQCDATPQIAWTKNGLIIQPNYKTMLEYRNGVCRLSIPQAYAGKNSCFIDL